MNNTADNKMAEAVAEIATRIRGAENLATQNHDSLDFHELAVWNIQRALETAYAEGRAAR